MKSADITAGYRTPTAYARRLVVPPLMSIGGRDHMIVEKVVLWGAIAFSAASLVFALLNLTTAIIHPPSPFTG